MRFELVRRVEIGRRADLDVVVGSAAAAGGGCPQQRVAPPLLPAMKIPAAGVDARTAVVVTAAAGDVGMFRMVGVRAVVFAVGTADN